MFSIRHPEVRLPELLSLLINLDFSKSGQLGPYLKGRSLWCYTTCSEMLFMPTEHNARLKKQIVEIAIQTLRIEKHHSVKLVATRALVRYARKVTPDDMKEISQKFETILDDLLDLLEHSKKEAMYLPIQAF